MTKASLKYSEIARFYKFQAACATRLHLPTSRDR
jgi:hypothetical protein